MLDQSYYQKADEIIECYGRKSSSLIPIMQDIQEAYRYLPGELLTYVAEQIGITEAKAYSVATFYENFSFEAYMKVQVDPNIESLIKNAYDPKAEELKKKRAEKMTKNYPDLLEWVKTKTQLTNEADQIALAIRILNKNS